MKSKNGISGQKTVICWPKLGSTYQSGIIFQREHVPQILNSRRCKNPLLRVQLQVVQVVNDLMSKLDMPSKGQLVNQLIDGVLLMANSNTELNLRCREALKPELRTSYCYLCAPSNPITTELFGDDLPKAVKDITDTNRITSKLSRETKQSFKRSRSDGHSDRYQDKYRNNNYYSGLSKNYRCPLFSKKEGGGRLLRRTTTNS